MIGSNDSWPRHPEHYLQIALGGALTGLVFKGMAYGSAGSAGFLSDAGESFVNLLTALLGLYGAWWGRQPRDREHPYGHGKVEALFSTFQVFLIVGTSIALGYTILIGEYKAPIYEQFSRAATYEGIALGLNVALAYSLWRGARRFHSSILRAEALHLLGDSGTSLIVIVNFWGIMQGWSAWVDKGVGLLIIGFMTYGSLDILKETTAVLTDTQDPALLDKLAAALEKHRRPSWIDVHNVRIQHYGKSIHVDGHVTMPWYWSLEQAHAALKEMETLLAREMPKETEFFWHMDPCEEICCKFCAMSECPHRRAPFQRQLTFTASSLFLNHKGPKDSTDTLALS
ncbi:MAG: cation diffusion facilitator family transporter [Bacteroidia bacterium]|nr:cation diffusion facilitator family transporter [Bacteroidia bacterium]MDW8235014.1 cation diffusion facilitator family transporter [Bacteroidia bacterium]